VPGHPARIRRAEKWRKCLRHGYFQALSRFRVVSTLAAITVAMTDTWRDITEWHQRYAEAQRELRIARNRASMQRYEARQRRYAAEAKAKRHANRIPIACTSCGETFVPVRKDSKTCSNKCRQRMHRARVTANKRLAGGTLISRYGESREAAT
jgi:hypothetical protein